MQRSLRMTCTFALPIFAIACTLAACLAKNTGFADDVDGAFASGSSGGPSSSSGASTSSGSGSGGSSGKPSSSGTSSGVSSSGASSGSSSGSSSGHTDSGATSSGGSVFDGGCDPQGGQVPTNVKFDTSGNPTCVGTAGCSLKTNVCCVDTGGLFPKYSCVANTQQCSNASTSARFGCVQKSDCPGDQICCLQADQTAMTADSVCMDAGANGKCSPPVTATSGSAQLCQTDKECKSGCCIWQDCTVMGNPVQLTMCGLQSSPLNCTAH